MTRKETKGLEARSLRGFTLIETLVAVSLLTVAIVAPMSLTVKSLASAYYARDQITAFYLAQEAIESVHAIRDGQILQIAKNASGASINLFGPIPVDQDFTIDTRQSDPAQAISTCAGACPPLQTDGELYGYGGGASGWANTNFTRTVHASFVGAGQDELRVSVTVSWKSAGLSRTFTLSEDLYRWVKDGSAAT